MSPLRQPRSMLVLVLLVAANAFSLHPYPNRHRTAIKSPSHYNQHSSLSRLLMMNGGSGDTKSKSTSVNTSKLLMPVTAAVSLSLVTLAAFTQHLPGPPIDATAPPPFLSTLPFGVIFAGSCEPYSTSLVLRDLGATLFSIVAAAGFVKSITYPAKLGKLDPRDARKLIHTFSAPLFILVWPLFSNAYGARVFASIVPLLNAIRLFVAGTGAESQNSSDGVDSSTTGSEVELANAISRSGDAKEALQGPFVYVMVLLFSTFFFWIDNPVGVVSIATMAVGDGLADLIGRRFGASNKWQFNKSKSIAGSSALVVGSLLGSYGLLSWLVWTGTMDPLPYNSFDLLGRLLIIATVSAAVELAPVIDDNYSVPITAGVLSTLLLN
jgi:dolichol kinase